MNNDSYQYGRYFSPGLADRWYRRITNSWRGPQPHWSLAPLGLTYGLGAWVRRAWHERFGHSEMASVPVVSIGNLAVGGSGKTPLCLALARLLLDQGRKPAVISRGYGRRKSTVHQEPLVISKGQGPELDSDVSGDEPWLMASQMPELRVVVGADRVRAARLAVDTLQADIIILDDGFQQLALAADCRVLLIPAHNPFGNGAVLPAGPLRERVSAHRLADILVTTGSTQVTPEVLEMAGGRPTFAADYHPLGWQRLGETEEMPPEALAGRRVVAFCGLGRPDSFERSLRSLGLDIRRFIALRDHQVYDQSVLDGLGLALLASGAEYLVTTAKDAVKLPPNYALPVMVLRMETAINQPGEFLEAVLRIAKR